MGPVGQIHDIRRIRIMPNLLETKVASFSRYLIQSEEFAKREKLAYKDKESEMNYIHYIYLLIYIRYLNYIYLLIIDTTSD